MNSKVSRFVIAYGIFLIVIGILGYASNPERAATAIMSGGTAGTLSIIWGILIGRHHYWSLWGAIVTTSLLGMVFLWRSWASWSKYLAGEAPMTPGILITAMLLASIALLPLLSRARRGGNA